jgi:hypothetical protein
MQKRRANKNNLALTGVVYMNDIELDQIAADEQQNRSAVLLQYLETLKRAGEATDDKTIAEAQRKAAVLYPQASMELQQQHRQQDIPRYIKEYETETGKLARSLDRQAADTNMLNELSQASAMVVGVPATKFSGPSDEEYKAKREALYTGLKAKMEAPYIPRMPGVGSQARTSAEIDPIKQELLRSQIDKNKALTEAAGKPRPGTEDRMYKDLEYSFQRNYPKVKEQRSAVESIEDLVSKPYEELNKVPARAIATNIRNLYEVGVATDRDVEPLAGDPSTWNRMRRFLNKETESDSLTPQDIVQFRAMVKPLGDMARAKYNTAAQSHLDSYTGVYPGMDVSRAAKVVGLRGSATPVSAPAQASPSQPVQGVQATTPAVPATSAPRTIKVRQISSGLSKTLPIEQAKRLLSDPSKFEEIP